MHKILFSLFIATCLISCIKKEQEIIDDAIEIQGGSAFQKIHTTFTFRGIDYELERNKGEYTYQRTQKDSLGNIIKDVLKNNSFERLINNSPIDIADSTAKKYENSVNSVAYFFFLPCGLNDPAVNKAYEKELTIKGQKYHQIRVWFNEEGGGEDHQDIYKFWINADTKTMDYLAYSYETSGGGVRFREAINRQKVGTFFFQDYNNYGYEDQNYDLDELPIDYEKGTLPFLSIIKNENISLVP